MSAELPVEAATFILVEYPLSASRLRATRRKVRSHVTRLQHKRERDAALSRSCTIPDQEHGRPTHSFAADSAADDACLPLPALPQSGLEKAFSCGSKAFSTFVVDDANADAVRCLQALNLDISTVISRWRFMVSFWSRDRQADSVRETTTANARRFFDLTFGDPVLLTAAIILTVRNLCRLSNTPSTAKQQVTFLTLEQHLIGKLNQAICAGTRGISDHMLVAIALCSTYELLYGSIETYKMHMRGLMQMIHARGGLPAIGASDEFCRDWLIWHDVKTSPRAGQGLFFDKLPGYSSENHRTVGVV